MSRALDRLVADFAFGWRVFSRQRLRTAIAVLTLSLAIGANAAIFSVLNAVILRPFPFPAADRMVLIVDRTPAGGGTSPTIPELLDLRARSATLDVATFFDTRDVQVDGGAEPVRVLGARVEAAFLPLVGAQPARGRLMNDADSAPGSPRVVLLGDALWHRNFGADPNVIGRQLVVDGEARTIAGVLAPGFSLGFLSPEPPEIYIPYPLTPDYTLRSAQFANVRRVTAIGRVKEGSARAAASAELAAIGGGIAREHPALYSDFAGGAGFRMDVEPLRSSVGAGSRGTLWLLFGAVALVLMIGCLNAAQFLLSQAVERGPEVSLRNALGAGRARLVTQFLTETLVLAVAAAGLGILQAIWLLQILRSVLPPIRMVGDVALDMTVLAFTIGVAVIATVMCGLLPAFSFSRAGLGARLIAAPRDGSASGRGRARQLLVAVQVGLSVVLLIQAALLMRTLQAFERSQSGFSADTVVAMRMRGMSSGPGLGTLYAAYLERLAATPGIAVAAVTSSPLPGRPGAPFTIYGSAETDADRSRQSASYQIVSPEYFSVLGIPLRDGRTFQPADSASAPPVVIVNEEMARRFWRGRSPLGQQIRAGAGPREATMTIIGIVGNVRTMVQGADVPQIYVSYLQQSEPNITLLVRPQTGPLAVDAVKRAIWTVEPRQAVFGVRPLDDLLSQSVQSQRVMATLINCFAALALAMSMAGVFAVVSYLTSRRQREIAIRRAIGAQSADVLWLLSAQTLKWTLAGLAAGVAGAMLASQILRANVTGLVDLDVTTVALTSAAYLGVALVAMLVPARKALRVDPSAALRGE